MSTTYISPATPALPTEALEILKHTNRTGRYVTDPTDDTRLLVSFGYLRDHDAQRLAGGMHYYTITTLGKNALRMAATKKIALPTRSQAFAALAQWQLWLPEVIGYVVFFEGKPCSWSVQPKPAEFRPGCISVDIQTGAQFELIGGDEMSGGREWKQLSQESP